MTTAHLHGDTLRIRFTTIEKVAGLLRDFSVPTSAVRAAEVVPDGLSAARGIRAPGLALPGLRKIGTWRRRGTKAVVAVRRNRPAIRIRLDGHRYDALLLDVEEPGRLAAELTAGPRRTLPHPPTPRRP